MPTTSLDRRPTWEIVDLVPTQGDWDVASYLELKTNRPIEFNRGFLEFLPTPDGVHQDIASWVRDAILAVLARRGRGIVRLAPFKVRVAKRKFREPDVSVLLDDGDARNGNKYWLGADVAVEVVSADDPRRDYVDKRRDYARAGIREYWIVDPTRRAVRQLALDGKRYRHVGTFRAGDLPTSTVLDDWRFDVAACMAIVDAAPPDEPPAAKD